MIDPLQRFVARVEAILDGAAPEPVVHDGVAAAMQELVASDGWLLDAHARPGPERYQQYLLHNDLQGRFSVVSFVWGPGQETPVHDHTVWGVVGMLRGAECSTRYAFERGRLVAAESVRLEPGEVERVSPRIGDIHRVANASREVSISIHCYGADIGTVRRHTFNPEDGSTKEFVSGYANA